MKFNKQSLEEQVTDYLREKIISGEISQGEKIIESTMAKELDLSRSTIRMALNSLSHEGLVISKPYAGWHVISLNEDDLWELYNLRVALESQSASMAAEQATDKDKQELQAILNDYLQLCEENPTDLRAIIDADFALHNRIVEASNSKRMEKIYSQIANQLKTYLCMTHYDYDISQSGLSHKPIIDAIINGDPKAARTEAKANITPFTDLCALLKAEKKN
ncbi:GntR family transcriptional regulator [Photobacterium jeanii]|uniref:GntR family transcriptional regulator n=1 Tax=Photobacterium jeanii TaxID=858640 RepID=A0A178K2F8_9GAMM|nr:GntR family transcriptional regulator [Photobacterium jeanii]OAN10892.1 GntR family transcriptional regulator [Photobacterium jeanii]PST90407.1 GntR family transcriptional regulator [Photobacterium jeanii]